MNIEDQPKIRVVVRKRPMNRKELSRAQQDVIDVRNGSSVIVREMKQKVDLTKYIDEHHFNFDRAFGQTSNNQEVYEDCVKPIVHCAFLGAKVTCFAYGQTGSGKTYTMNGDSSQKVLGLYVLGAQDIFKLRDSQFKGLGVSMSFYQIYCGKLFDLLNNREQLQARQDAKQNVNIVGLTERKINSVEDFMSVVEEGGNLRITSQNSTNADSSRSHAILQISLLDGKKIFGKLSFIDLAGCERGADTIDMSKQTRLDGAEINKSLLALKECIRALDNGKAHTPFRGSKLTMVLKDSLTGFCRTVMIGNISPNSGSCQNTLNTLRYADRVKQLKKPGNQNISKEDQLAKELMLPRMLKNRQTVEIQDSDDDSPPKITYVGAKLREAQITKTTRQVQQINQPVVQNQYQNRKKSVFKEDGGNSRIKQERRGQSAHPKQIIPKSAKPPQKPPSMSSSTADFNQFPKQPKILMQQKGSNSTMFNRQQIKTQVYAQKHNWNKNQSSLFSNIKSQLVVEPTKHKLISSNKLPTNFLKKQSHCLQNSDYAEWEQRLQEFRRWKPENQDSVHQMSQRFQGLVGFIMREEQEVLEMHKIQMETSAQIQEHQQKLYDEIMQQDNSNQQFLSYSKNLEQLIETKITNLVNLKTKLTSYRYHLTQHEVCQKKLIKASEDFIRLHEDVQLLQQDQMFPPVTLSLPELPPHFNQHISPRLFQNSSQYNITQSIRRPQNNQYDQILSNYNSNNYLQSNYHSNVTHKTTKNTNHTINNRDIDVKLENYSRSTVSYNQMCAELNQENYQNNNDCYI